MDRLFVPVENLATLCKIFRSVILPEILPVPFRTDRCGQVHLTGFRDRCFFGLIELIRYGTDKDSVFEEVLGGKRFETPLSNLKIS